MEARVTYDEKKMVAPAVSAAFSAMGKERITMNSQADGNNDKLSAAKTFLSVTRILDMFKNIITQSSQRRGESAEFTEYAVTLACAAPLRGACQVFCVNKNRLVFSLPIYTNFKASPPGKMPEICLLKK